MELSDLVVSAQEAFSHPGVRCCIYAGINAGIAFYNRKQWSNLRLSSAMSIATVLAVAEVPLSYENDMLFDNAYLHMGIIHLFGLGAQIFSYAMHGKIEKSNLDKNAKKENAGKLVSLHSVLYPGFRQQSSND